MGKYTNRQMRFRIGQINAGGGRPINEASRTIKTVTAAQFGVSGTPACGNTMAFSLTQIGTPADPEVSSFTIRGTAANHPSEWVEVVAAKFKVGRVLSSMYRFNVRFVGTDSALKDFVFAYKFGSESTAAIATAEMALGTKTIDSWKDMRQSRGWVWKRFSAINAGGSMYPSQGVVEIKIPDVLNLAKRMFETSTITEPLLEDLEMDIADAADSSVIQPRLHVVVMTIDGVALTSQDIVMDLTVYQTIRISRHVLTADMIDEADQVT